MFRNLKSAKIGIPGSCDIKSLLPNSVDIDMKGVSERSSVFASEIYTTISPIPEKPPEVIHINKIPLKELAVLN